MLKLKLQCFGHLMQSQLIGKDSYECLGQQGEQTKSILKEINPEYSLEGLMLKLKLQYLGHLMQRANSLGKTDAAQD